MKRPEREKMVVYEVVEVKEPERENTWGGPLLAFIFIVIPFIFAMWWKGYLDFSQVIQ